MSVPAAFWTSMVRVTSVPEAALSGTVKFTVLLAVPPLPATMAVGEDDV